MEKRMENHKYADLFPMMTDAEIAELASDIRSNGQKVPIYVDEDGNILDGRNRFAACTMIRVKPIFERFYGTDEEKLAFVGSQNLQRRHLTVSDKIRIALEMKGIFEAEAAERQKASQAKPGKNVTSQARENFPAPAKGRARDKAAERMGISGKLVDMGAKIKEKGVTPLQDAFKHNEIKAHAAAAVASLPPEEQHELLLVHGAKGAGKEALRIQGESRSAKKVTEVEDAAPDDGMLSMGLPGVFADMEKLAAIVRRFLMTLDAEERRDVLMGVYKNLIEQEIEKW